jgi:metal-responsive CopG/Arc/MetJ family transcriptional regulator
MSVVHYTSMTSSTIVAATMNMTVKLGITLPKSILQKIDNKRGYIPRSRYIRRAIERYLGSNNSKGIDNNHTNDNKAAAAIKRRRRK